VDLSLVLTVPYRYHRLSRGLRKPPYRRGLLVAIHIQWNLEMPLPGKCTGRADFKLRRFPSAFPTNSRERKHLVIRLVRMKMPQRGDWLHCAPSRCALDSICSWSAIRQW